MARPKGAENLMPTRRDTLEAMRLLKNRAREGDTQAAGMLVLAGLARAAFAEAARKNAS